MANTFDTSRVGGGTYELEQDASGNYNLKSVGFTQVNKLNLPDLKTSDTSVADTTKKATEDTIKAQTTEVFKLNEYIVVEVVNQTHLHLCLKLQK
jgi:hypothetical protein